MWEGKRTHQEGTQKCYSHHRTRSHGDLRERSALFERIDIVERVIIIIVRPGWRRGGCAGACDSINGTRLASSINTAIVIGLGGSRGPSRSGGSSGRAARVAASRNASCIAATSGANTAAKGLAGTLHSGRVHASWVG